MNLAGEIYLINYELKPTFDNLKNLQNRSSSDEKLTDVKQCMGKFLKNDKARNYFPVYYDAWSNDNNTDPVMSIIFTML